MSMTESEAIRRLKDHFRVHDDGRPTPYLDEAVSMAIHALEEIQQYRAIIGLTPEDLKALEKDEIQTIGDVLKAFAELEQYRAIGTVKVFETVIKSQMEYCNRMREYEKIGTVSEFRELKEKATAKFSPCPKCGSVRSLGDGFCYDCGTALDLSEGKE